MQRSIGSCSSRASRRRRRQRPLRPQLRPVPKELGEGLREIADPELRACLESLGAQIAASSGPPSLDEGGEPIPVIKGV